MPAAVPEVAVVGLGLVGGSLARALTVAGYPVVGVDHAHTRRQARAAGAVAATVSRVEQTAGADIVVLAAPPVANRALLRRLARVARPGLVITDVGSVKGPIVGEAEELGLRSFVGGHVMAGSERRGFGASTADLFEGATWWLVPSPSRGATRAVRELVRAVGARPQTIAAATHDRVVAFLSHAPQLTSWALFEAASSDPVARRFLKGAGPGFRDMTRLARSPRGLWREILRENQVEVARSVAEITRRLATTRQPRRRREAGSGRRPARPPRRS